MMAEVSTASDFDRVYSFAERDLYWALVHHAAEVLSRGFNEIEAHKKVERYRELAAKASLGTQAQVYHQEPFTVAADLLNVDETDITDEIWNAYQNLASDRRPPSQSPRLTVSCLCRPRPTVE